MKLYCATTNAGKLCEFRLAARRFGYEILPVPGHVPPCTETGRTFEENAVQKALHYGSRAPGLLFADDSGLQVDALDGAPGIVSARYAGDGASDDANNRLLLEKLRGVPDRSARFVCALALVDRTKVLQTFHGTVEGQIADDLRGERGFGYDPLFFYPPLGCTFAEMPIQQKMEVSHRSKALAQMFQHLGSR